jgi:hypothetical protein
VTRTNELLKKLNIIFRDIDALKLILQIRIHCWGDADWDWVADPSGILASHYRALPERT